MPVVALFANWFEVDLVELCLDCHLLVAGGAGEVVHAPRLVQGREHVSLDDLKMTLSATLISDTKIGEKAAHSFERLKWPQTKMHTITDTIFRHSFSFSFT